MSVSYSFHVGSGNNSISSSGNLRSVDKHNLRKYKSDSYNADNIVTVMGSDNIFKDVQKIYHSEFDDVIQEYNSRQKRTDRQIRDYFSEVSEDNRKDLAVEIIVQIGDKDFWELMQMYEFSDFDNEFDYFEYDDISFTESSSKDYISSSDAIGIYKGQLNKLQELLPDFKIANATIHFDESSPHMHIVGVPVADGFKRGLSKQVAKSKVFTKQSLEMLQEELHNFANEQVQKFGQAVKSKSNGHIHLTKELYVLNDEIKRKKRELASIQTKIDNTRSELTEASNSLKNAKNDIKHLDEQKNVLKGEIKKLNAIKKPLMDTASYIIAKSRECIAKFKKDIDDIGSDNAYAKFDQSMNEVMQQATTLPPPLDEELGNEIEQIRKKAKNKIVRRSDKGR